MQKRFGSERKPSRLAVSGSVPVKKCNLLALTVDNTLLEQRLFFCRKLEKNSASNFL